MNYFRTFAGDKKSFIGTLFPFLLLLPTQTEMLSFKKTRATIYTELVEKTKEIFESLTLPTHIYVVNYDTVVKVRIRVEENNTELEDIITKLRDVAKMNRI